MQKKYVIILLLVMSVMSWAQSEAGGEDSGQTRAASRKVNVPLFIATSEITVMGGNLPKSPMGSQQRIEYQGTFIDALGAKREIRLIFHLDPQEINRWILTIEVESSDDIRLFLHQYDSEEMQTFDKIWLDFNNQGQLARFLDMAGQVREEGSATIYLQYILEDTYHLMAINFGVFAARGNFLTQFKGQAQATLRANGYTTLNI